MALRPLEYDKKTVEKWKSFFDRKKNRWFYLEFEGDCEHNISLLKNLLENKKRDLMDNSPW